MKNIIFLIAALIALCSAACTPSVQVTQRQDTWQAGNGRGAIYDIVVSNAGTCGLTSIFIDITLPSGATLNNYWNLQQSNNHWEVTNYQGLLPAGASVNTGVSINFPGQPTGIVVVIFSSTCPTSCPTSSPTSTPPTIKPTSTPTSTPPTVKPTSTPPTVKPTSTPTIAPTSSPSSCTTSVQVTQRPDTWQAGNGRGAIFDIVIRNSGTCGTTSIFIDITLPSGATLNNYWNLQPSNNHWEVTNYEGLLPAGASVNTGVSINFPGQPTAIVVVVFSSACSPSCPSSPTTTPPTIKPTSTPPTVKPTSTPTSTPTIAPTSSPCNIAASLRLTSSWTTNGVNYATYAIFVTNNGNCPMTNYVISFALNGGEIIQSWNLDPTRGGYAVQGYGSELRAGDTYGGAGFNVRLEGSIQITPYGSTCRCQ